MATLCEELLEKMRKENEERRLEYDLRFDSKNKLTKLYRGDKYVAKFRDEKEALGLIGLLGELLL